MTAAALTANPVRALTTRLGEETENVLNLTARLTAALKAHDHTCQLLNQHGLPQLPDFGVVGNAASRARRAELEDAQVQPFALPKAS